MPFFDYKDLRVSFKLEPDDELLFVVSVVLSEEDVLLEVEEVFEDVFIVGLSDVFVDLGFGDVLAVAGDVVVVHFAEDLGAEGFFELFSHLLETLVLAGVAEAGGGVLVHGCSWVSGSYWPHR